MRPPKGNYIIYMRAINDLAWCNGGSNGEYQHKNMLNEDTDVGPGDNNNWRDGWWEQQNADWNSDLSQHADYHYVYIYTQIGETTQGSTAAQRTTAEWYFGKKYV